MSSSESQPIWVLLYAMPKPMLMISAVIILLVGTTLLWSSWRKSEMDYARTISAWVIISLSTPFFIASSGPEFGISIALMTIALIAWFVIAKQTDVKPLRALPQSKQLNVSGISGISVSTAKSSKSKISAQVFALIVICPVISLGATMSIGSLLPADLAGQLVVDALLYPVVWALFAIWLLYTANFWRWSAVYLVISVITLWANFG